MFSKFSSGKFIATNISVYLESLENSSSEGLVLYRGVSKEHYLPTDGDYSFFSKDKSFAEDYGDYIWKCLFGKMNIFISYKKESLEELYNNGIILRDHYIEDMWDKIDDDIKDLYNYDEFGHIDTWGYKSADHAYRSRYTDSDTWEMIEKTHGALDYILSKYDGVELLEDGRITYYLRTDKIVNYERVG